MLRYAMWLGVRLVRILDSRQRWQLFAIFACGRFGWTEAPVFLMRWVGSLGTRVITT